jgi:hypothetical protein
MRLTRNYLRNLNKKPIVFRNTGLSLPEDLERATPAACRAEKT